VDAKSRQQEETKNINLSLHTFTQVRGGAVGEARVGALVTGSVYSGKGEGQWER